MRKLSFFVLFLLYLPLTLAHGFGIRIDLPLPLSHYLLGGAIAVGASFLLIALFLRKSTGKKKPLQYNLMNLSWFRFVKNSWLAHIIKGFFVLLLFLLIGAALFGNTSAEKNIVPSVVWIYFAVGLTYVSALIGNVWHYLNPWKTLFVWYEMLRGKKKAVSTLWKGVWPAVVLFFAYRWVENASDQAADPQFLGLLILGYSFFTWYCMGKYGMENWLAQGDPFHVMFTLLSKFSITEYVSEKEVNLRPPFVGLAKEEKVHFSKTIFILLMMATITYDGVKATEQWYKWYVSLLVGGYPPMLMNTLVYVGFFALFVGVFLLFSYFIKAAARSGLSTKETANHFALSLLPIAVAYEIVHYMILLMTEGQRIVYLISDPLGLGWNLFGTAAFAIDYSVINFLTVWNVQVFLIVLGHIVAVYLAHAIALRLYKKLKPVIGSQIPMTILMILYTITSLWILAQPLTGGH